MTEPNALHNQAPTIFTLVSRLYTQRHQQQGYSLENLLDVRANAQMPVECVQAALHQGQTPKCQRLQQAKRSILRYRKALGVGAVGLGAIASSWLIWSYFTLFAANQSVDASWAKLERQLQHQANSIPSLVDAAQADLRQRELAAVLAQAHQSYLTAHTRFEKMKAAKQVADALSQFQQEATRDPQMASNPRLIGWQNALTEMTLQRAIAQDQYNQKVLIYNRQVRSFPNSLIAPIAGIEPKPLYETKTFDSFITMP